MTRPYKKRSCEREPADSLRDKSNVIVGWLPSLTFALGGVSMRRNTLMKFTLTMMLVCALAYSASAFSLIGGPEPPAHDWTFSAPGGRYGVVCYSYGTLVVFGSHSFFVTEKTKVAAGTLICLSMIAFGSWRGCTEKSTRHDTNAG